MQHMVRHTLCLATVAGLAFGTFGGTTVYVDCTSQATEGPYTSPENAATNITEAMTYVSGTLGEEAYPVEIRVAKGTYAETGFTLGKAIAIVGDTGNPADVIINDNVVGQRAFTITHADAALRNLTITGAGIHKYNGGYGGHVNMTAGLVENCVIRDGYSNAGANSGNSNGKGGNVYMTGGRLVRCQILNGRTSNGDLSKNTEQGGGIFAGGSAVLDSCLIMGNNPGGCTRVYGGGVYAEGSATIVNCTIGGNKVTGIYVNSKSVKVLNTVMINNGGTAGAEFGGVNPDRFSSCASSVTNASCATWKVVQEDDFIDVWAGDYRPQPTASVIGAGSTDSPWRPAVASELDLDGNPRVVGGVLDIGCYAFNQSALTVGGSLSSYAWFEGVPIHFDAGTKGASGGILTYRWDFGNGETKVTTDAEFDYAYPTSGLFTVSVSAKEGEGAWTDWFTLPRNVVVMPQTTYVDETCANPVFPYKTPETASTNVAVILQAMTNNISAGRPAIDGMTIRICAGTLNESGIVLSRPITICGDTGDPDDVVINDNVAGKRAFTITHPDAVVRDLTISGEGLRTAGTGYGGHVNMTAGLVENCIIRDGCANTMSSNGYNDGKGGNVYMTGGRLVRCQILGGRTANRDGGKSPYECGAGVFAGGTAVVDSCLVKGNNPDRLTRSNGCGIYADGSATIVNCTLAGNKVAAGSSGGGIYVNSASARVVNTILIDNGGTEATEFGTVNLGRFFRCASTVTNTGCATWTVVTEADFVGVPTGDYQSQPTSPCIDSGTDDPTWCPADTTDLDVEGNPRVSGGIIDLGCYELDQSKVSVGGSLSTYGGLEDKPIRFSANAKGGEDGDYAYCWDFGDGNVLTTSVAEIDYAYPESGLFTVRVAAKRGDGEWTDWTTLAQNVAVMPETTYVDEACATPVFPYKTPGTAATKISTILLAMTNNVSSGLAAIDGATIRVCAGTLNESGVRLSSAVTVCGDTGNPNDVIINDADAGQRAFTISHAGAVVRDLTITGTGSSSYSLGSGGHVYMTAGLVENCIIRDGYASWMKSGGYNNGKGGNVYMSGGRLVRCQILGGWTSNQHGAKDAHECGAGVFAGGTAIVDSCLVKGNNPNGRDRVNGAGIYAEGSATIVNCTIGGNKVAAGSSGGGIYVNSPSVKVVNTVLVDNGGTAATEFGTVNLERFFTCASTVTNTGCATWTVVTADDFVGVPTGDYRPQPTSPCVDSGTDDPAWCPADTTDLDVVGSKRVSGGVVDLGCYELDQSVVTIGGSLSAYGGFEGEAIRFSANAKGGDSGAYTYRWDFGNGVTNETTVAEIDYAYPGSGLFTVRVAAKRGDGEWTDWTTLSQNVAVMPETTYVDGACTNSVFPYKTRETAATKISTVLLAMTNNVSSGLPIIDGATICVCTGTVTDTGNVLSCPITIRGETGNPDDVVIHDAGGGKRAFTITHADAIVRDLTIKGSGNCSSTEKAGYGGHVVMSAGLVENCIIRDGRASTMRTGGWNEGKGGNVYMTGGRLVRCQILGGRTSNQDGGKSAYECGAGVYAAGSSIVDSCLVKGNNPDRLTKVNGAGIYADGSATIVNCTLAGNKVAAGSSGGGIYVNSASVKVVNTVMVDNGGTEATEFGTVNPGRFFTCASTVTNASCATWTVVTADDFVSVPTGDYRPQPTSPCIDSGTDDPAWCPEGTVDLDLVGGPRISGEAIDLGCYELDQSKVSIGGKLSTYGEFEGGAIRFTANAKGGEEGAYAYRWDFGNGETRETAEADYDYAYPTSGLFTVRVMAKRGDGEWTDWTTLAQNVAVMPETTYVDGACTNSVFPYKTRETAATKISTVLLAMTNNVSSGLPIIDGATICVCTGTVTDTGNVLSCPVTIRGETGNPDDVVIHDAGGGKRAFTITHPDAVVRDLTISGTGCSSPDPGFGGHVYMTAGLVENCIIRDGYASAMKQGGWNNGKGGNVYTTGGRLVRCQILNGWTSYQHGKKDPHEQGAGIFAGGTAIVDSCLVKDNNPGGRERVNGGGVYAEGSATIVNCTIAGNKVDAGSSGGGIYVNSASVKVVNTVMFDNGGTDVTEFGGGSVGQFICCASSVSNEVCETWQIIDETAFRDWASRDTDLRALVPAAGKPLVGTGTDAAGYKAAGGTATLDLLGKPRRKGRRIDIGCLESQQGGSALILR